MKVVSIYRALTMALGLALLICSAILYFLGNSVTYGLIYLGCCAATIIVGLLRITIVRNKLSNSLKYDGLAFVAILAFPFVELSDSRRALYIAAAASVIFASTFKKISVDD
jgi:hypothetical protein